MNPTTQTLGPIRLAPGVTRRHVLSYLFAALCSIGLFTYLTTLTPYVLRVNLALPPGEHGAVSGTLQFWQEIVLLAVIGLWGAASDRVGRRAVYVAGFVILALAYALYPFAGNVNELFGARMLFGVGVAATAAMLSTIVADYPEEGSRGKLIGLSFFLNGVGSVVFFVGLTRMPHFFATRGADELAAGRWSYLVVAGVALLCAVVMLGLKPGLPEHVRERKPLATLLREGLAAARNPRIGLAYGSSFAARADMSILSLFLALWVTQTAIASGLTPGQAAARAGMTVGIAQSAALVWAPIFGAIGDRLNRVTVLTAGFALAAAGYTWVSATPDLLSASAIPALLLLGVGQASTILASTLLLGQEAPPAIRGSVFGVQSFVGGVGILAISVVGGIAYDRVSPSAPFLLMGVANALVVAWALLVRRRSPAPAPAVAKSPAA